MQFDFDTQQFALRVNIAQSLCRILAKELCIHDACLKVDGDKIRFYTGGMYEKCLGYWTLRWNGNKPILGAWYEETSMLNAGMAATERIHEQMNAEGLS